MNIYILRRSDATPGLPAQVSAMVVIAADKSDALNVPKTAAGPNWRYWWTLDDDHVTVDLIGQAVPMIKRGVVIGSWESNPHSK